MRENVAEHWHVWTPYVAVYRLRGVRLMPVLDELAHVGCCGVDANMPCPRRQQTGRSRCCRWQGLGRPATDMGRERTAPAPAPAGGADPELLVDIAVGSDCQVVVIRHR
jgi:hypothetical protein